VADAAADAAGAAGGVGECDSDSPTDGTALCPGSGTRCDSGCGSPCRTSSCGSRCGAFRARGSPASGIS
jgi:hypothetical protein